MQAYQENISAKVSGVLSPVLGVRVTVTDTATGNPAALYSDNGVTPVTQPLITDETGYFGFYAANGQYTLSFASAQVILADRTIKLYDPADDPPLTQAQAAAPTAAAQIGHGATTVGAALSNIAGPAPVATSVPNDYSGNLTAMPITDPGELLQSQVWKTPVHIDLHYIENPALPTTGPLFKFGNTGLTSGAFWSQDSYVLRNGTFVAGPPETVSFEPWTGMTARIEGLRIVNSGNPAKWHLNFKQQNWWPIVSGNVLADYTDKKGNFCKAVDDEGDASLRYSGNSRLLFAWNRLKWLGAQIGGIGFYGSAVGNTLRDNAFEGSGIAAILGAPSTFTNIDGLYNEMPFGGQVAVMLGDQVAAPNNTISLVGIRNLYSNVHGFDNNAVVTVGNSSVVVNELTVDRVYVSNLPANPQALVRINDLPGQKIRAGHVYAEDAPLIPLLTNHVAVIDMQNATIPALNGDMVFADSNTTNLTANTAAAVARNWYAKCSAAATFNRGSTGANRRSLRQARYLGSFSFAAGSSNLIAFELPRANLFEGEAVTAQWLSNSSVAVTSTVTAKIYNPDGTKYTLRTKTVDSAAIWREHTMTFYVDLLANSEGSLLVIEISNTTPGATTFYVAGMRFNRGSFGLSGRADGYSYNETAAKIADYTWISP